MVWALAAAFVYNSFTLNTYFINKIKPQDSDPLHFTPIQMIQLTAG